MCMCVFGCETISYDISCYLNLKWLHGNRFGAIILTVYVKAYYNNNKETTFSSKIHKNKSTIRKQYSETQHRLRNEIIVFKQIEGSMKFMWFLAKFTFQNWKEETAYFLSLYWVFDATGNWFRLMCVC